MQRSTVIVGLLAAGVAIALITSIGAFTTVAESQSNNTSAQDKEMMELLIDMKSMMARMNERTDMMLERMDAMMEGMDMMMGMMMGDMMGPMNDTMPGDTMQDMMNQEPQDVIIKMKVPGQKVQVGKEAEIVLLVLDKDTKEPMEGVEVQIGIEKGSSMSTMEMMGDMFLAEDKGSGEYIVRFTPDSEGVYTIHVMVMLPGKSMMDNHMDFGIIAE
jgi:hypothetical protein